MKNTGITRKLDELGRIVIPKEIRNNFKIEEGDQIEFYLSNDEIFKLFQLYNLKFHNSIAIVDDSSIVIGYGKHTNSILESLTSLNSSLQNSKTITRYKHNEDNYLIANISGNKCLIIKEEKPSTSTDSAIINLILDYLIKLLKEE